MTEAPCVLPDECRCAEPQGLGDFRDFPSYAQYAICGLCQLCQDRVWLAVTEPIDESLSSRYLLRRGVVFAFSMHHREAALVPFIFGAPGRPPGLELNHALRVGPDAEWFDPYPCFVALDELGEDHIVSTTLAGHPADPQLDRLRGSAIVLGTSDQPLAPFVEACPALAASHPALQYLEFCSECSNALVDISTVVRDWGLDPVYEAGGPPPHPLRVCAWILALLRLPLPDDRIMLDAVVDLYRVPLPTSPSVSPVLLSESSVH